MKHLKRKPTYQHYPAIKKERVLQTLYEATTPLTLRQILIRCGAVHNKTLLNTRRSLSSRLSYWRKGGVIQPYMDFPHIKYTLTSLGRLKAMVIMKGVE